MALWWHNGSGQNQVREKISLGYLSPPSAYYSPSQCSMAHSSPHPHHSSCPQTVAPSCWGGINPVLLKTSGRTGLYPPHPALGQGGPKTPLLTSPQACSSGTGPLERSISQIPSRKCCLNGARFSPQPAPAALSQHSGLNGILPNLPAKAHDCVCR